MWKVVETRVAAKELLRLPRRIVLIYCQLVQDLESEGPTPYGWDVEPLKERDEMRIRLNREYRVLVQIRKPQIIVVRVAHRKEAYK